MSWKNSIKKEEVGFPDFVGREMPDKVTYDSASIRKKLKAIGEYRDSLVGKTFTAKENMKLQQLIMDLVNEYNRR